MTIERSLTLLDDLQRYCNYVIDDTAGQSEADYLANRMTRQAVERNLEIIGEIINRLMAIDPSLAEHIMAVRRIIGLRNRLAHGYDSDIDDVAI